MNKPKHIKGWEELSKEKSPTHILEIDLDYGCGWLLPKNELDSEECYYLSTHTFYGANHKRSTEPLQAHGFNVRLANWDELEEEKNEEN